jgi:hypothetical protein
MKSLTSSGTAWLVAAVAISSVGFVVAQPSSEPQQPPPSKGTDGYELRVTPATQPAANVNAWTSGSVTTPQGTFTFTPATNVNVAPGYNVTTTFTPNVATVNTTFGDVFSPLQMSNVSINLVGLEQKVPGAYMGVGVEAPGAALRSQLKLPEGVGLVVNYVDEKGPSNGVIHQHDVLEKLDDQLLVNAEQLVTLVRLRAPGAVAQVTLIRESRPMTVTVKLGEKEQPPLSAYIEWQPSVLKAATDVQGVTTWSNATAADPGEIYGTWQIATTQPATTQPATQPAATTIATVANGFAYVPQVTGNVVLLRNGLVSAASQPWVTTANASGYVTQVFDDAALVAARASRSGPITIDDGETLTWIQRGPQGMELTVVDRASGKVSFKGPVGSDEQWQKVPEEVRLKFEAWKAALEQAPKPPEKK